MSDTMQQPNHSRWKTQTATVAKDGWGNCTQAAIASYLGLELDEVPDFNKQTKDQPEMRFKAFWEIVCAWFLQRGFVLTENAEVPKQGLWLAMGLSPRGHNHLVVFDATDDILHDPHPDRTGLVGLRSEWQFFGIVPTDPLTERLG